MIFLQEIPSQYDTSTDINPSHTLIQIIYLCSVYCVLLIVKCHQSNQNLRQIKDPYVFTI